MDKTQTSKLSALVLTYNEERNIERVLAELQWIEKVIVLDSYSTDATVSLIEKFPNTEIYYRKFDTHATQWNYGLSLVQSPWVLSMDADYVLTKSFIEETRAFIEQDTFVAFQTRFKFVVFGKPLRRDNTTPRPVLFRKSACHYYDDGHTQRLRIDGRVGHYRSFILHDDRKPLSRWLANLDAYSIKECRKMLDADLDATLTVKIRRTKVLAPFLVFFYCLLVNGAILDGWRGWHYTLQRTLVEILFALRLIEEEKLEGSASKQLKEPVEGFAKLQNVHQK